MRALVWCTGVCGKFGAVPGLPLRFVWDQAGGVLSYAAVPRVGLWPTAPPLCRYAEYTADLILEGWWVFSRYGVDTVGVASALRLQTSSCRRGGLFTASAHTAFPISVSAPPQTHPTRCPCAWCVRRSGIKEEAAAVGRSGGQPRSRTHQVHGRTSPCTANDHIVFATNKIAAGAIFHWATALFTLKPLMFQ